jgi:hypothetical protein
VRQVFALVDAFVPVGEKKFVDLNSVRMVRMFKVVRIFGRLKRLNQIIMAITATLIPVANTFLLVGMASSIYAVLATSMYQNAMPEYFGSWSISSMTLLQLATFDSWSDLLRELTDSPGVNKPLARLFVVSYLLIVGIMMLNVVIAVPAKTSIFALPRSCP